MRILLSSNGHLFTNRSAYNLQLRYLVEMFVDMGHHVTVISWALTNMFPPFAAYKFKDFRDKIASRVEPNLFSWFDYRVLEHPNVMFMHSCYTSFPTKLHLEHLNRIIDEQKIDLLFTLQDLGPVFEQDPQGGFNCRSICWVPLHYDPVDLNSRVILQYFSHVLALCPSAKTVISKHVSESKITVLPHVVEFDSVVRENKTDLRKKFNIPVDTYLLLVVAGNYETSHRKSFDTIALAYQEFRAKTKRNVLLWIHSSTMQIFSLNSLLQQTDLPAESYRITNDLISRTELQKLYMIADVLVSPSRSEGFGIPIMEAQSVGLPVITTKFLAMADYTKHGICVPPLQRHFNNCEASFWVMPSVAGVADAMRLLSETPADSPAMVESAKVARKMVEEDMSSASVKAKLQGILNAVMKMPAPPVRPLRPGPVPSASLPAPAQQQAGPGGSAHRSSMLTPDPNPRGVGGGGVMPQQQQQQQMPVRIRPPQALPMSSASSGSGNGLYGPGTSAFHTVPLVAPNAYVPTGQGQGSASLQALQAGAGALGHHGQGQGYARQQQHMDGGGAGAHRLSLGTLMGNKEKGNVVYPHSMMHPHNSRGHQADGDLQSQPCAMHPASSNGLTMEIITASEPIRV